MSRYRTLTKDILREIANTRSRFVSIFAIIALGAGFYSGVKTARPNMADTAQLYFDSSSLSDVHIISTLGFTSRDLELISSAGGVRMMRAGYSADVFFRIEGSEQEDVARLLSYVPGSSAETYLNMPEAVEGRLPESAWECAVDAHFRDLSVGDRVSFYGRNGDQLSGVLKTPEFTVTGKVNTAEYISFERGIASIGNGKVSAFVLIPYGSFAYEAFTDVYVSLDAAEGLPFESDGYAGAVSAKIADYEAIARERGPERLAEVLEGPLEELADAREKLADGYRLYYEGKDEYEKRTSDARKKIQDGWRDVREGEKSLPGLRRTLADGEAQWEDGYRLWAEGRDQYLDGAAQLAEAKALLDEAKSALRTARNAVSQLRSVIKQLVLYKMTGEFHLSPELVRMIKDLDGFEEMFGEDFDIVEAVNNWLSERDVDMLISRLTDYEHQASAALAEAQAQVDALEEEYGAGQAELRAAKEELDEGEKKLSESRKELDLLRRVVETLPGQLAGARRQLAEAQAALDKGVTDGRKELEDAFAELMDAQVKIDDAEEEIAKLSSARWYVNDRDAYTGYRDFQLDTEKVERISVVIPVFFVLVASLVCLTTMTRMVEDERTQIGTLKALGYPKAAICAKYVGYAASASLAGSAAGLAIGFTVVPMAIFSAYSIIYNIPDMVVTVRTGYTLQCVLVSLLVTGASAFSAVSSDLKESPASLLRPRAPKPGKTNFVERVSFIWKSLGFLRKVTVRNIFRYKKRVMMTVVGIAGCTALILVGFGLKHAIGAIADRQFQEIFVYSAFGMLEDDISPEGLAAVRGTLAGREEVSSRMFARLSAIKAGSPGSKQKFDVNVITPEDPSLLDRYVRLKSGGESFPLTEKGAVITVKLASMLGLEPGDAIDLYFEPDTPSSVTVTAIAENYVFNYVYITPSVYGKAARSEWSPNGFYLNTASGTHDDALSEAVLQDEGILALQWSDEGGDTFRELVSGLNYIILVIIVFGGMLAFVVLYNMASINMTERMRELATIKVLGFFDKEVSSYINRENTISSVLGVAAGIGIGIPLERFVITTAEVDVVMFARDIDLFSYFMAVALTLLFTAAVNVHLHFRLKKVRMAESLKSVD